MPSTGFELSIPATHRPQTYALDLAVTRIEIRVLYMGIKRVKMPYFVVTVNGIYTFTVGTTEPF
jgi:hypothetical protein